jgi:hypothetical protein
LCACICLEGQDDVVKLWGTIIGLIFALETHNKFAICNQVQRSRRSKIRELDRCFSRHKRQARLLGDPHKARHSERTEEQQEPAQMAAQSRNGLCDPVHRHVPLPALHPAAVVPADPAQPAAHRQHHMPAVPGVDGTGQRVRRAREHCARGHAGRGRVRGEPSRLADQAVFSVLDATARLQSSSQVLSQHQGHLQGHLPLHPHLHQGGGRAGKAPQAPHRRAHWQSVSREWTQECKDIPQQPLQRPRGHERRGKLNVLLGILVALFLINFFDVMAIYLKWRC